MPMGLHVKKQTEKNKNIWDSVSHAIIGLKLIFKEERNFRFHLIATLIVILAGVFSQLSRIEWLFILGSIGTVLVSESFNSVIERVADALWQHSYDQTARLIKDMAAGAVLITAFVAAIIGLVIFGSRIL